MVIPQTTGTFSAANPNYAGFSAFNPFVYNSGAGGPVTPSISGNISNKIITGTPTLGGQGGDGGIIGYGPA